ncbi:hypothetical protein KOR34_10040 [Posidoniimonas corsicana]|uniref:Uncharacterized protein n=1 Tax=Posidoniimonas corsicana TaxID=1938618 RepID=A0A5C5VEI7_9BACT|nr:hypothetical protein KOR34_10040 [Posidoniimonas corsicana]
MQPPGQRGFRVKPIAPSDWVVYRKRKHSSAPGPRATNVSAAPRGETYSYAVDKYWVVKEILDDQRAVLITRTGKEHTVSLADPNLRRASWWERLTKKGRFRETQALLRDS